MCKHAETICKNIWKFTDFYLRQSDISDLHLLSTSFMTSLKCCLTKLAAVESHKQKISLSYARDKMRLNYFEDRDDRKKRYGGLARVKSHAIANCSFCCSSSSAVTIRCS